MTDTQRRMAAKQFATDWAGRGDEKQETQTFWIALLQKVYDVAEPDKFIQFEVPVKLSHTSFIDGYIGATHVLIEQKGAKIDLNKGETQSDGSVLTPYGQARRYAGYLPHDQNPRWIVVCNFQEFRIHDMNRPNDTPEILLLSDLEKEYHRLDFLVDTGDAHIKKEMEISLKAGDLVGVIYDALLKQYADPNSPETLKSLNALCVRLVFCLYAEDAGIFGKRDMFHDYLNAHRSEDRRALINLFRVLDQKPEERDKYLDDDIAAFPYVNGGLFADENIEIPRLGDALIDLILTKASEDFDWSAISPTIFGAVFESTLNPETRRSGGMHYTSIENIHKVIDPLFLDELNAEFAEIKEIAVAKTRNAKLNEFQRKLAGLKFLDPACGSGNFLTETYLSLRRLENEVISMLHEGQIVLDFDDPIQVSIDQFYGIEINDFAVTVAKTALWIAESQMMKETENVVHMALDFLPLKTNAHIVEGNALRLDWESVVPKRELNYIMGNPPFVGKKEQTKAQKDELVSLFHGERGVGNLDYVTGWYVKAVGLLENTPVRAAFVSTNSITQGEQVPVFWKYMLKQGTHIDFAYRTFQWDSEAALKAHVHCVIIGFSQMKNSKPSKIYLGKNKVIEANNINPYLVDAPSILVESRGKPLCDVPQMSYGSMPIDDGHLILEETDVDALLQEDKDNLKFVRKYGGGAELIQGKDRWCLWLVGASPKELQRSKIIMERVRATADFRRSSNRPQTLALADTPTLFGEIRQPSSNMLVIPKVSSEKRRYIPISYVEPDMIINGSALIIPDATLYDFGVITSNVHNAWMRTVAGRLEMRYQYSGSVVYNNFPWPTPTDEQRAKIEQTAQAILDARALYPECSLADLYDEVTMPPELRKAHQRNDRAVMAAYGITKNSPEFSSEAACVAMLMKMYQALTQN
jgi:methylase of polypeptide subunit release factors